MTEIISSRYHFGSNKTKRENLMKKLFIVLLLIFSIIGCANEQVKPRLECGFTSASRPKDIPSEKDFKAKDESNFDQIVATLKAMKEKTSSSDNFEESHLFISYAISPGAINKDGVPYSGSITYTTDRKGNTDRHIADGTVQFGATRIVFDMLTADEVTTITAGTTKTEDVYISGSLSINDIKYVGVEALYRMPGIFSEIDQANSLSATIKAKEVGSDFVYLETIQNSDFLQQDYVEFSYNEHTIKYGTIKIDGSDYFEYFSFDGIYYNEDTYDEAQTEAAKP